MESKMRTEKIPYCEFSEGIFEIDEFDCASIFVIAGQERALVLDTGTGIGNLRGVIENRITKKPYDVVLTHNHVDHAGGAGFFDSVWIHEADREWDDQIFPPTLAMRREYAQIVASRGSRKYDYTAKKDILAWPREPEKKMLRDGQQFDLGGRTVTFYHIPGHTKGECAAVDDKSRILFIGDACNCNYLLGENIADTPEESAAVAIEGLERIWGKRDSYDRIYNSHHDYREVGRPLAENVLPNLMECLREIKEGTCRYSVVPDMLSYDKTKKVAVYGNVQVTYLGGEI